METNTYTTAHIAAGEGYYLTEASEEVADNVRSYCREIYCRANDPQADAGYWREIPQAEAEAAMAARMESAVAGKESE